MKGKISINDDKGLEHEADVMGQKALSTNVRESAEIPVNIAIRNDNVQREIKNLKSGEEVNDNAWIVIERMFPKIPNSKGDGPERDQAFSGTSRHTTSLKVDDYFEIGDEEIRGFVKIKGEKLDGKDVWVEKSKIITKGTFYNNKQIDDFTESLKSTTKETSGLEEKEFDSKEAAMDALDSTGGFLGDVSDQMDKAFLRDPAAGKDYKGDSGWGYKDDIDKTEEQAVNATGAAASGLSIFSEMRGLYKLSKLEKFDTEVKLKILLGISSVVANATNLVDAAAKASGETNGIGGPSEVKGLDGEKSGGTASNDAAMITGMINNAVSSIKDAYLFWKQAKEISQEGLSKEKLLKLTRFIAKATQSAAKVAKDAFMMIDGVVPLELMKTIPGLGAVINLCGIFIDMWERGELKEMQAEFTEDESIEKEVLDANFHSADTTPVVGKVGGVYRVEYRDGGYEWSSYQFNRVWPYLLEMFEKGKAKVEGGGEYLSVQDFEKLKTLDFHSSLKEADRNKKLLKIGSPDDLTTKKAELQKAWESNEEEKLNKLKDLEKDNQASALLEDNWNS